MTVVAAEQQDYVARNTYSLAQAFVEPRAWVRAVYADEEPVGFMMVRIDGGKNEFFLWRFMIAAAHQGKGYGRRALELLVDEVRRRGGSELVSSYGLGEHGPAGFYHAFGFVDTGEVVHREAVIKPQL